MTNAEYNRDVKRLKKQVGELPVWDENQKDVDAWYAIYQAKENAIKKEISRLFYADTKFSAANKDSILTLLRLNLRFRAVPLHIFGINIEI